LTGIAVKLRFLWVSAALRCARTSLASLVDESSTMLIARSTCSDPSGGTGNGCRRSLGEQICEPQRKRIRFGLVTLVVAANLPEEVKPDVCSQATSVRGNGAIRGGWEQRAGKEVPRNLGEPLGRVKTQLLHRMHKVLEARWAVGRVHSSFEAGNDRRAKGRDHGSAENKAWSSA
jgi:hypothetical protein